MRQMLAATGWQKCRGTLGQAVAEKKLKIVVHRDVRKATRWEVVHQPQQEKFHPLLGGGN